MKSSPTRPGTRRAAQSVFLNSMLHADRQVVEYARGMTNANLSNHRPENLLVIDDLLDESIQGGDEP